jgi:hypothetical protein
MVISEKLTPKAPGAPGAQRAAAATALVDLDQRMPATDLKQ